MAEQQPPRNSSDRQIIAQNRLTRAVVASSSDNQDQVAQAEAALAMLAPQFDDWMKNECARLDAARNQIRSQGLNGWNSDVMFKAAHDIKGEAATLGHPLIESVAKNLCQLLEYARDRAGIPLALIDRHVDAIGAIMRAETDRAAKTLATRLNCELVRVTAEYLIREDITALAALDGIESPPLAP